MKAKNKKLKKTTAIRRVAIFMKKVLAATAFEAQQRTMRGENATTKQIYIAAHKIANTTKMEKHKN